MTEESLSQRTSTCPISEAAKAALGSNLRLIHKVVSSVRMPDEFREDAFQEAALAFLDHYEDYDPNRATLSTFMWPQLRGAVTHFLRSEARFPACTDDDEVLDPSASDAPKKDGKPLAMARDLSIVDPDVMRFLRSLDVSDRTLLFELYWQDVPPSAFARSIGISRQSLHVRHKRLIAQARTQLSSVARAA